MSAARTVARAESPVVDPGAWPVVHSFTVLAPAKLPMRSATLCRRSRRVSMASLGSRTEATGAADAASAAAPAGAGAVAPVGTSVEGDDPSGPDTARETAAAGRAAALDAGPCHVGARRLSAGRRPSAAAEADGGAEAASPAAPGGPSSSGTGPKARHSNCAAGKTAVVAATTSGVAAAAPADAGAGTTLAAGELDHETTGVDLPDEMLLDCMLWPSATRLCTRRSAAWVVASRSNLLAASGAAAAPAAPDAAAPEVGLAATGARAAPASPTPAPAYVCALRASSSMGRETKGSAFMDGAADEVALAA